jgi:starch phosphorylase
VDFSGGDNALCESPLTFDQVLNSRGCYRSRWPYDNKAETRAALDFVASDHFSREEPGGFAPVLDTLLRGGDHHLHLADIKSYGEAQGRIGELRRNPEAWSLEKMLS